MLHTPEEILEDTEKALEEMLHAAELLKQEEEKLDALKEVNQQIRENNRDWFGED
jgi:predicted RNase H-like HicB family nuclease